MYLKFYDSIDSTEHNEESKQNVPTKLKLIQHHYKQEYSCNLIYSEFLNADCNDITHL